jgi:hypothetical protein
MYSGQSGFYCFVEPDSKSLLAINSLVDCVGPFVDPELDIHCTIMYSPINCPSSIELSNGPFTADVLSADLFGEENTTLVLTLESKDLQTRHDYWISKGCESTYELYRPHLTLAFNQDWQSLERVKAYLQDHSLKLRFLGEHFEDIQD